MKPWYESGRSTSSRGALPVKGPCRSRGQNDVACLLADHEKRNHRVVTRDFRENRSVHHTKIIRAVNFEIRVQYSAVGLRRDLVAAGGMVAPGFVHGPLGKTRASNV